MDLRYLMLKGRYRFSPNNRSALYDIADIEIYKKEITLLNKELALYEISLKNLANKKIKLVLKNEFLDIAVICAEDSALSDYINIHCSLPIKKLCSLTKKTAHYFEKWGDFIIFFYILLKNNSYPKLLSYFNIQKNMNFMEDASNEDPEDKLVDEDNLLSGIIVKKKRKLSYIINAQGDVYLISTSSDAVIGEIAQGKLKSTRSVTPLIIKSALFIIAVSIAAFVFLFENKTMSITVNSTPNFSIQLQVNRWDKVIKVIPLDTNGDEMKESLKLINLPYDEALKDILEKAKDSKFINKDTNVIIGITENTKDISNSLKVTKKYIAESKINVIINNNGKELE